MTPLPAFSEQVVERRDLPEYEIEPRCSNPRCPNRAEHKHEIRPRSQTAGLSWWIEIPGRFLLGNRIGLCAGCHRKTDDHTAAIIWDEQMAEFAWCDLAPAPDGWAEALNPMPPIHKIDVGAAVGTAESERVALPLEREEVPGPSQQRQAPDSANEAPVPASSDLGPAMQNMERFLGTGELPVVANEAVPPGTAVLMGEDGVEEVITNIDQAIQPVELLPEPDEPVTTEPMPGDNPATVARAREATQEALQHAQQAQETFAASAVPWRADIIVHPDENRVEVLTGDLRVGTFLEETIAKAKRAPKPREPKPVIPDDGTREPAKARRTYSISVPADERDGEKVAAGEDGYQLIEEALDNLRQRFGDDDHPGWRYYVLMKALGWMLLNYTDDGED